ncbi:unnamed protein product [Urochloa decumbens]|uniref:VWFA domain-containing protein n=1 Tax=Urochloa decumbens TaxID=240449 RepID=A0ABC9AXE9_9POAL
MSGGAQSAAIQATATAADQQQRQAVQVTVSTVPVLSALPRDDGRKDFEVLVRVRAPTDATRRAPVDLVAVLDVSASMARSPESDAEPVPGERSRLDLLKDAMRFIVGHLSDGDRLAIVAFDHNVYPLPKDSAGSELTKISEATRKSLNDTVGVLKVRGYTLFGPGLDMAIKILDGRSDTDKVERVGFIVFLSDGKEMAPDAKDRRWKLMEGYECPNDWKKLEGKLKAAEHTVHTFGFSKFHDSSALHDMADVSGGTYSFLNTGLDKIMDSFAMCLGGLGTVVASNVKIDLAVQDPKVKITAIDAGGYANEVTCGGSAGEITIPALYASEVKDFIVHLDVPSHGKKSEQDLLRVDGLCRLGGESATSEIKKDNVTIDRPPAADEQKQNGEVIKQVLRFKILQMLKHLLDESKKRGWDLKGENRGDAEKLLGEEWGKLKENNQSILSDLHEQQLGGVVESYDGYVTKMRDDLKNGDGGAHVRAFESSNKLQRVTTMGSPENVIDEFKTDEINKMGRLAKMQRGEPVPEDELPPPPPPPPLPAVAKTPEERLPWPCACPEYDIIGEQLAYWSVVKRDLLRLVEQVEGDGGHRILTGTFRDLSLASINRAMYESVFLAVEHAHNLRSGYCAATGRRAVAAGYDGEERYQYDRQRAVP